MFERAPVSARWVEERYGASGVEAGKQSNDAVERLTVGVRDR
jgi:hypothetical protein